MRQRVAAARQRQRERYAGDDIRTNAELTEALVSRFCQLDPTATRLLMLSARRLGLSARGYDRVRKVARTIADLDAAGDIGVDHLAEALQFRLI